MLVSDETEWLAEEVRTEGQGFVLRTRGCERKITGLKIKNAAQPNAAKGFRVSGTLLYSGEWINLAEGSLEEETSPVTYHFSQSQEVRFIKFLLRSSYGGQGGLSFFTLQTGNFSQGVGSLHSPYILRNNKKHHNFSFSYSQSAPVSLFLK